MANTLFATNLDVPIDATIIALSDVHADIDSLIIALRDCAKVISKDVVRYAGTYGFDPSQSQLNRIRLENGDAFLEHILSLDLNDPDQDKTFDNNDDLGYIWTGGNTHVVIVGDILDGVRTDGNHKSISPTKINEFGDIQYEHQYYQIEVKILKFLNRLDERAARSSGAVIKLIGNHEAVNFFSTFNKSFIQSYTFGNELSATSTSKIGDKEYTFGDQTSATDLYSADYYKGKSRIEYFSIDAGAGFGYDLFRKRGTGVMLIINNNIFVHGSIVTNNISNVLGRIPEFKDIDTLNSNINSHTSYNIDLPHFKFLFELSKNKGSEKTLLWERSSAEYNDVNDRFGNNDAFCDKVEKSFARYCAGAICDPNKARLIVGHCIQSDSTIFYRQNIMYKELYNDGKVTEHGISSLPNVIESDHVYKGYPNTMTNNVFGITMECKKPHSVGEYYVHRVDVGSSRAFDNPNHLISKNPNKMTPVFDTTLGPNYGFHRGEINRLFLSRSPSVLKIKGDKQGDVSFIRSNYENTRKGQIRLWLERIHGDINTNRGTYINPNRDPSLEVIGATGIPPPSKLPTDFAICYQADNGSEYFYDNVNNKPIHIDRMTGKINDIDFSHRSANDIDKCKSLIRRGENFLFELKTGKKLEQLPLPPKSGISGGRLNKYIKKNDMLLKLILEKMN